MKKDGNYIPASTEKTASADDDLTKLARQELEEDDKASLVKAGLHKLETTDKQDS